MRSLWRTEQNPELEHISHWFNRILQTPISPLWESWQSTAAPLDVSDDGKNFRVVASVPGAKPEDIDVNIENGILTLSGEIKHEAEEEKANYYHKEISRGAFRRSIKLPENAQPDKVQANFQNGILTINIPEKETKEHKVLKVPIQVQGKEASQTKSQSRSK